MVTLFWITLASTVAAHEVLPTIGDMELQGDTLTFSLQGNFESLVAGINLAGLEDTELAPEAERYDELRAMDSSTFGNEFNAFWPAMADQMTVLVDGEPVALELVAFGVPEVGNVEVVRQSTLTFTATVPEGAETFQIDWPAEFGVLVLRQQGVEAGWDGYLSGGLSEVVSLSGGDEMTAGEAFVRFIPVGVEHIVPLGLDHILFVLGLFFLSVRMGPLLWRR